MSNDSNSISRFLYSNCMSELPTEICAFGNISGLIDTIIWFFAFLPQIYQNFKRRSVEGLSVYWIIANFTACLINLFFVFEWGVLPIFVYIYSCYAPVIQGIILIQILLFTSWSRLKWLGIGLCFLLWCTIACLLIFLPSYNYMQWITVSIWCIGSYSQV